MGFVRLIVIGALFIALLADAHAQAALPSGGLLGADLARAQQTDLFTFFRLEEVEREQDALKRTVVIFKPSGRSFRKLVTLRATLAARRDTIAEIDLQLARPFIDEPATRTFANDIVTNFLLAAPAGSDLTPIRKLVQEIRQRPVAGLQRLELQASRPPELPAQESPGYLVYVGKKDRYVERLAKSTLTMNDFEQQGSRWLGVQVVQRSP